MLSLLVCWPPSWPLIFAVCAIPSSLSAATLGIDEASDSTSGCTINSDSAASTTTNSEYAAVALYLGQSTLPWQADNLSPLQLESLGEVKDALELMQSEFFELWLGDWPGASDWTGAVMGTYVSATLSSLTKSTNYSVYATGVPITSEYIQDQLLDNLIGKFFSQTTAYYFGENAFSIRTQAYDDMLWVVLGWLEGIKFMNAHDALHYNVTSSLYRSHDRGVWHGKQFEAAFAHRSHVFYEIVHRGWDKTLCGGGLTWNPSLEPYKNTITNTLFISASTAMYLYHPGDSNHEPFLSQDPTETELSLPPARPHDPKYLTAAKEGYDWLLRVNLTNSQGLFVDGYHINNYRRNGTTCDLRNEMVYTYNQGVLLSGLRGLWESTGNLSYLAEAHKLVHNVIAATGWNIEGPSTTDSDDQDQTWQGLGRHGILHEFCDPAGNCSQDAQTFKGIFFHHLTLFCEPLPTADPLVPGITFLATPFQAMVHAQNCREYIPWVARNARAALDTRNDRGLFGMWWSAHRRGGDPGHVLLPRNALDVRNHPEMLEEEGLWKYEGKLAQSESIGAKPLRQSARPRPPWEKRDYNDRGRGRTVETQGGGLMVVRALWELRTLFGA